jgi:hypothetical protein
MPHYRVVERSATLLHPRLSSVSDHETRPAPMSHATPIVFAGGATVRPDRMSACGASSLRVGACLASIHGLERQTAR